MKDNRILSIGLGVCVGLLAACSPPGTELPELAPTASPTSPPTPAPPVLMVGGDVPCYSGPGVDYAVTATIVIGNRAEVVGLDEGGEFWIIRPPAGDGQCWVERRYATLIGKVEDVPTLMPASLPTKPAATPAAPKGFYGSAICIFSQGQEHQDAAEANRIHVQLNWTDVTGEAGYQIYKDGALLAELQANMVRYDDWFVLSRSIPGQYTYAIEAFNAHGSSARVEVRITIPTVCKSYGG